MASHPAERTYMSLWHLALMTIGVYEFSTHKNRVAKFLACGMILFHADATIADALDRKSLSRILLEKAIGTEFDGYKITSEDRLPPGSCRVVRE